MKKFRVNMTVQLDTYVDIEAQDAASAREKVYGMLGEFEYDPKNWDDNGVEIWSVEEIN